MDDSKPQRALVFQGGGSLGAYEAGVFHVLYHWIKKDLPENENIYDIIAGTSIGAINASIIINCYLENKEKYRKNNDIDKSNKLKYWKGTPERTIEFWNSISSSIPLYDVPALAYKNIWDFNKNMAVLMLPYFRNFIESVASGESFRRYYSTKKRIFYGEPNVFWPKFFSPFPTPIFNKFFDYSPTAIWYQYSNVPFGNSIQEFANKLEDNINNDRNKPKGIETDGKENDPRLLLIVANIETGKSEAFDSFENNITLKHVLASAAIPINYPYMQINGKKYWDGGILSNTPVRELISKHNTFWTRKYNSDLESTLDKENKLSFKKFDDYYHIQEENKIPNLLLDIVNLHPDKETGNQIPSLYDYDMTKDRMNDIQFHDKTEYDVKISLAVSDYHDFVKDMTKLAKDAIEEINEDNTKVSNLKDKFRDIINCKQRTLTRNKEPRYYYDLIGKRFDIERVIKIQRRDDIHTISDKIFDFSSITISNLIREGEKDALDEIVKHETGEEIYSKLNKFIDDVKTENTNHDIHILDYANKILKKYQ
ncbi:MAG: patatin-like phospholipase family protein [Nitrososphaeraceae archaeon]